MNIILLGPQGSGKGTQAELLAERFHLQHLEMGRIFRSIANSDHPQAAELREMINQGRLAPDSLTGQIAEDFIVKHDPHVHGFVFEGYPRTLGQYEHVKTILQKYGKHLTAVFNLEISQEETVRRLSARRTCAKCGRVFNLITNPPRVEQVCDNCGGALVHRDDDKPEAITRRLELYRSQTHPVFMQAVAEGIGYEVNGERPIETIFNELIDTLAAL